MKLSRYSIELNEDEKLINVIFTSINEDIYFPVICKNTDKFNIIENKFYENYPEYSLS